jgi:pre-rRNA-processing protein TSR1
LKSIHAISDVCLSFSAMDLLEYGRQHKNHEHKDLSAYQSSWKADESVVSDTISDEGSASLGTDMRVDYTEDDLRSHKSFEASDDSGSLHQVESGVDELYSWPSQHRKAVHSGDDGENSSVNTLDQDSQKEREEEKEDLQFPDEISIPPGTAARVRFQKYRGLQSIRHSSWDAYENLPNEYARIFQFQNFSRSRRRVLSNRDGIEEGTYVAVYLSDVSRIQAEAARHSGVMFALLPYEQKISAINFVVRKHSSFTDPVKSKVSMVSRIREPLCLYRTHRASLTIGSPCIPLWLSQIRRTSRVFAAHAWR